jgi:hypothetical protein
MVWQVVFGVTIILLQLLMISLVLTKCAILLQINNLKQIRLRILFNWL